MRERTAVCPGSFDPVTVGHIDIIRRASKMFDHVIVVVMINAAKQSCFSLEERVRMLRASTAEFPNVRVDSYNGLLAEYAASKHADAIVKGLRAMSDFEYEFQMALTNKKLSPDIETVFLTTSAENMYLSSSMVKQIASMGGDVSEFVPEVIHKDIVQRLNQRSE